MTLSRRGPRRKIEKLKTIAIANQKGSVGKTTTAVNLGVAPAKQGKRVILVDAEIAGQEERPDGIQHSKEGFHYIPSNIELDDMDVKLVNTMCHEVILRQTKQLLKANSLYVISMNFLK